MSALDVLARLAGFHRVGPPASLKQAEAPYAWPVWQDGEPDWTPASLESYAAEGYERNAVIYACISRKAETAAVSRLRAFGGERDEPEALPDDHPLAALILRPNPYQSWYEMQELLITYLELDGNVFVLKARSSEKSPVDTLYPLRSDRVRPVPKDGTLLGYAYDTDADTSHFFLPEDIIHVKYPNPRDPFEGLGRGISPLTAAARTGDIDNAVSTFLRQFFDNAVVPFGLLTTKQKLIDSDVKRIRSRMRAQYGGVRNWGDIMILDADASYQQLGLNMQELGFSDLDAANEARICAVLKVPPIVAGVKIGLDRSTYSNYEEARRSFWQDTMVPIYQRFEDGWNQGLGKEFGDAWLAYDFSQVPALQEDEYAPWPTVTEAWEKGLITRNEARRRMGLEALEGEDGDVLVIMERPQVVPRATDEPRNEVERILIAIRDEIQAGRSPNGRVPEEREAEEVMALDAGPFRWEGYP